MKTKLLPLAALLSIASMSPAQAGTPAQIDPADIPTNGKGAYVIDSDGDVVRDSWSRCVRTNYWTPETAINKCEGIEEPKPAQVVVAPAPEPTPVVIAVPPKFNSHFDFDKANLKPEDLPELDAFAAYMNRDCGCKVAITGHADSTGSVAYNQKLSEERAQEVASYLANKGVITDRMIVTGMGESAPVADNKTKAGRAENRRAELEIVK